jgi:hypothetical protein
MYACVLEIGRGFFEGVCTLSNAIVHSYDPPHPPQHNRTGVPALGLRCKEGHALG